MSEARYDPFKAVVEPLDRMDTIKLYPLALQRSMMWDMVGDAMIRNPEDFGENPASPDVLEAEFKELVIRNQLISSFGPNIDMSCVLAATAATRAILTMEPKTQDFTEEEKEEFLQENIRVSTMVTKTVLAHMLYKGLIHIGAHA